MKSKLTKSQRAVLGSGYFDDIYHSSYASLHPIPEEDAYFEDEVEQTYEEFVDMGNRPPNEHGTGRFLITPARNRFACLFFTDKKKEKSNPSLRQKRERIKEFLQVFLGLPADIIEYDAHRLNLEEGTIYIGEYIYELDFYPKSKKATKKRKKKVDPSGRAIEVFSLFDALEGEVKEPYLSMVAFIDSPLCEANGEDEESFNIIYGRACGNRIACVSTVDCETFKELLCVTLHELLHTIGFDHCHSWKCLMNATSSDGWIFLSPVNLRKLKVFHKVEENNSHFLLDRYQGLLKVIALWDDSLFAREINWLQRKIGVMSNLIS